MKGSGSAEPSQSRSRQDANVLQGPDDVPVGFSDVSKPANQFSCPTNGAKVKVSFFNHHHAITGHRLHCWSYLFIEEAR